ncbi:SURF1 family protein [Stakelama saccharophila]|uniref:SURF1 family protein n=1 Tax=Stakelama saccharophila TaxID=3075605 RepID=UPI003D780464
MLFAVGLAVFAGFVALGVWQVHRRAWKLDLIARVEHRIHAAPRAAPGPARWPQVSEKSAEYAHVRIAGRYLDVPNTLVQASTDLGVGHWVLSPLESDRGFVVLVNRGFVPAGTAAPPSPGGKVRVTGLLRISQPGGGFLRDNDPAAGRWYSRDVRAIATARGLDRVAPYFIDADARPGGGGDRLPVGGLTVVSFPNNHLGYALTWFALAAMTAGALVFLVVDERRLR